MEMPALDKNITCCFVGYRPHKFTYPRGKEKAFFEQLKEDILNAIARCYSEGYRNFLCGGAIGFDIMGGEGVVQFKKEHPDVKLGCILPFEKQHKKFPFKWRRRYRNLLENSDFINYITLDYVNGCCSERTQKMLQNSSRIITYFDGKRGGTARVVAYAQINRIEVLNLSKDYPIPENITFFTGRRVIEQPDDPKTEIFNNGY